MLSSNAPDFPLITVGVVVFNREWIIKKMLASLQRQTYPHDKLFVVIVDGESKDDTAKIANEVLAKSDFGGYSVIVKKSNIPEARNLCIQNMKGDFLLYWDSDVIMESTAIERMVEIQKKENVDMVASWVTEVTVNSADEVDVRWAEWEAKYPRQQENSFLDEAGTGNILISKNLFEKVTFDPQLTFYEDRDFSKRAIKLGFKILETKSIIGFDINANKPYSSVYGVDMPIKEALRGIRKKGMLQADYVTKGTPSGTKGGIPFFLDNKRYFFYIGYLPTILLTAAGLIIQNIWLSLIFPVYLLFYLAAQIAKRGLVRGLNVTGRSIIVGVPTTYLLIYYLAKINLKKPK